LDVSNVCDLDFELDDNDRFMSIPVQRKHRIRRAAATVFIAIAAMPPRRSAAQQPVVAVSPGLFEYHSAFWVNLHHLLYEQARARRGLDTTRAIVRAAAADTLGIVRLTPEQRRDWDAALAYYTAHLATHDVLDRDMAAIKAALGDRESASSLAGAAIDDSLRVILEGAAPGYRVIWWPRHDAANRAWIAAITPLVAQHGAAMSRELVRIFSAPWDDFLIRVDASAYTSWAGAYTTNYPDRITVATLDPDYTGASGLEMLFHESLHTMDDSLHGILAAAAKRHGKRLPDDLTHAIIFFTAGEVARRELGAYEPFAVRAGIWSRGSFAAYLPILRQHWLPWIERRSTLPEAVEGIAAALP
jgi:hypothetical protein